MKTFLKEISASESINGSLWEAINENGKRWAVVNESGEQIAPEYSFINKMEAEDFAEYLGEFSGDFQTTIFKTRIIDLRNGSKRYFVEVGNRTFESSSTINYTHAVIGKTSENGEYEAFGFHSSLELAEKKIKKRKDAYEIHLVTLN